ncbi:tat pathway signal sequence [Xylariales sp. PMI_506]|nr:tat pathway signal sequence [Xylariales sp. PMI_506]
MFANLPWMRSSFEAVPLDEKERFLDNEQDGDVVEEVKRAYTRPRRNRHIWAWLVIVVNIMLFITSAICGISAYRLKRSLRDNTDNAILRMVDWYSPVHDQVQINIIDTKINGTLLDLDKSIFRQPPSPEVDAAWERVGSLMPHVISTEDVLKLGKDPEKVARWSEDWGFGPNAHVAEVDVLHQIHCLNAIRRDVHWRHYFGNEYPDGVLPDLHRVHTDHCIYIVLQNLMCSATADMVTNPWVEGQITPFPDFNINRKCRDFDAILDWHERTMVTDMKKYVKMTMPEGHEPYRMSEEFHRLFGTGISHVHDLPPPSM